MLRQRGFRVLFACLLLVSITLLTWGAVSASETADLTDAEVPDRANITVVATDSNSWLGRSGGGPRARAELVAFAPNGSTLYYNDTHTRYWDVDPVAGTRTTVEYVAADHLPSEQCGESDACTRNVVERVNLTTGDTERIYGRITPDKHATRWHDVDRLNDSHLVVADIDQDRVFVVDTTTDLIVWEWDAQSDYRPTGSGGPYPSDWTHLNDVEVLPDGRLMVSLRNLDRVVFLDPATGLQENWTLGAENRWDTLYEQHNPDYIPEERGGPAVLVADSENNRAIEYQRVDGEWERTWQWQDSPLQWPRDADRLPNGNTLITDSNGDRVIEVAPNGSVVWSVPVAFPYEAERLGTGDESQGGPSATRADLSNASASAGVEADGSSDGLLASTWHSLTSPFDGSLANGIVYILPVWMNAVERAALAVGLLTAVTWVVAEAWWSRWSVTLHAPLRFRR